MIYEKQRVFPHRPENDQYGDCFRTTLACLLDMQPEEVPHFCDNGVEGDEFWDALQGWLGERGMYLWCTAFEGELETVLATTKVMNPGCRCILGGTSPRGTGHVVVCLDGEVEWDPAPPGDGLIGPAPEDGLWWVYILGRRV